MRDWLVNLPEELTESDLIDMVEGTLTVSRETIAIAALKAEPRLGLLIKQMRLDKAAMASAPDVAAPSTLQDRVLETIDAQMIREIAARDQEMSGGIPISSFQYYEPSQARGVLDSKLFRFCAVAAAVLLVTGVTAYIAHEISSENAHRALMDRTAKAPKPIQPAAVEDAPGDKIEVASKAEMEAVAVPQADQTAGNTSSSAAAGSPSTVAEGTKAADASPAPLNSKVVQENALALQIQHSKGTAQKPAEKAVEKRTEEIAAGQTPSKSSAPATVTDATAPAKNEPKPGVMSITGAARLAKEGRLAIVIRPKDATGFIKRLDGLARAGAQSPSGSQREMAWRAIDMRQVPAQFAALTMPVPDEFPSDPAPGRPNTPTSPAIAGSSPTDAPASGQPSPQTSAEPPPLPKLRPMVKMIYTVEIEPSERGLTDLARIVGEVDGLTARYRLLDTPVVRDISLDPDTVLWWTSSPARWSKPAVVPLIIESRE